MKILLCGIAVAFLFGLARPCVAAQCVVSPPVVRINVFLPDPVLDNSEPQAAIQRRAPQSHSGHTVGLYVGALKHRIETESHFVGNPRQVCVNVAAVTVNLGVADRRIYLAREWPPGSCPYSAILGHERKHQAADDTALRQAAWAIRDAIIKKVAAVGPLAVPRPQQEAAAQRLSDAVGATFQAQVTRLGEEERRLQRAVDAGFEYARLTASCPEFSSRVELLTPLPPKGADEPPLLPGLR